MFAEIFQRQENEVKECGLKTAKHVCRNFSTPGKWSKRMRIKNSE